MSIEAYGINTPTATPERELGQKDDTSGKENRVVENEGGTQNGQEKNKESVGNSEADNEERAGRPTRSNSKKDNASSKSALMSKVAGRNASTRSNKKDNALSKSVLSKVAGQSGITKPSTKSVKLPRTSGLSGISGGSKETMRMAYIQQRAEAASKEAIENLRSAGKQSGLVDSDIDAMELDENSFQDYARFLDESVYSQAAPTVEKFFQNPTDDNWTKLLAFNEPAKQWCESHKQPELHPFVQELRRYLESAKRHHDNEDYKALGDLNEESQELFNIWKYPKAWMQKAEGNEGTASSEASHGICVKIQMDASGKTEYGQVVRAMRIGLWGCRVMLNCGTEKQPLYIVRPGADFGRGVTATWIKTHPWVNDRLENPDGLIDAFLDVVNVPGTVRQITYLIVRKSSGHTYCCTKSEAARSLGTKYTATKMEETVKERTKLQAKFSQCKLDGTHPDTGNQLSSQEKIDMPWLVSTN